MTVTSQGPPVDPYRPTHADEATTPAGLNAVPPRATTRVVLERDLSPFDQLDPGARRRLLVRVLCELVAYDAPEEPAVAPERLAG